MSREIPAELIMGPYDGRTGMLTIADQPPTLLTFSLADRDSTSTPGLIIPGHTGTDDKLAAFYVLIDEKPRSIVIIEDVDGHARARSEKGVRYKYDKINSPCERLFEQADRDALLTSEAHDQIMATRRLLLAAREAEQ